MTKNWIVAKIIEDDCGFEFESVGIDSFDTEKEAIARIAGLEAKDIEEYGKIVNEYTYYNINE